MSDSALDSYAHQFFLILWTVDAFDAFQKLLCEESSYCSMGVRS